MAGSRSTKKLFNMVYGIGASVVIIGALAKILHVDILGISGGVLLAVGMGTEAFVFFFSAFEPIDEEFDWSLVYPELKGGAPSGRQGALALQSGEDKILRESLSQKLDGILAEARIDANMMRSLGRSIENFAEASKEIAPVANTMVATHKYGEELSAAASNLESLNSLYKLFTTIIYHKVERWTNQRCINQIRNTYFIDNAYKVLALAFCYKLPLISLVPFFIIDTNILS